MPMKKIIMLLLMLSAVGVVAQTADEKVKSLYSKYSEIPNYSADVKYETINERMGFTNTQNGKLVVEGNKYLLTFGTTEKWLNNGQTEYIGTKEDDHSQILYFCPGQNEEAMLDFRELLTFYGSGHAATFDGDALKLTPSGKTPYVSVTLEIEGDVIKSLGFEDDFGTVYKYSLSNFSTSTSGAEFVINESDYREKIDERRGCK